MMLLLASACFTACSSDSEEVENEKPSPYGNWTAQGTLSGERATAVWKLMEGSKAFRVMLSNTSNKASYHEMNQLFWWDIYSGIDGNGYGGTLTISGDDTNQYNGKWTVELTFTDMVLQKENRKISFSRATSDSQERLMANAWTDATGRTTVTFKFGANGKGVATTESATRDFTYSYDVDNSLLSLTLSGSSMSWKGVTFIDNRMVVFDGGSPLVFKKK